MRRFARLAPFAGAVLLLAAGCQPINKEYEQTLQANETYKWEFDPPRYSQKLAVTVTPTDGPVSAYLVKADDVRAVEGALVDEKEPQAGLALGSKRSKDKAEEYTFEATVPAQTGYALIVKAEGSKATVKVRIKGR